MKKVPITSVASVIRSKNAGPFELTLDILFKDKGTYLYLKNCGFFSRELFAALYDVPLGDILKVVHFDPAFAVKCTMVRQVVSGTPGDTDVYGAQQHAPLLGLEVPVIPD
jgi:hypothetical protein